MINAVAVESMFNHYHTKVKTNPSLYTNRRDKNKAILVVLPKELLDYANHSSGHSGFAAAARPVGIRRVVDDAKSALNQIFSSVASLTRFIESSECDAAEYIERIRRGEGRSRTARKLVSTSKTDDRLAKEVFFEKYSRDDAKALQAKFGYDLVVREFNILTINEFELRFGL
jgi:hypothetical protein